MQGGYPLDMDGVDVKRILHTLPDQVNNLNTILSSKPSRNEVYLKSDNDIYIKSQIDNKFNSFESNILLINKSLSDLWKLKSRGSTVKIAAHDATSESKSSADYVCSGIVSSLIGDEITIMQAISNIGATGGSIEFSEGTFVLGGYLIIPNIPLILRGQGNATKFESEYGGRFDMNGCVKGITLQDMYINSNTSAVYMQGCSNVVLKNIKVYGQFGGIYSYGSDIIVDSCHLSSSFDYENYIYLALFQINGTASISNSFIETMELNLTEGLTPYSPMGIVYSCMTGCMVYYLIKRYNGNTYFDIPYTDNCWIANEEAL